LPVQAVKLLKEKKMKKFIVAIAALAMLTGSAYAADWNFYGSARVSTFWSDTDTINGASGDTVVSQALQGNARIGANVKASDELTGRFEYGASGGNANIRLLYGVWNFGAGTLLVGQDYVPMYLPGSNQVYGTDNGLGGYGEMYGGRKAQLKLTFGGFQVAAVAPSVTYETGGASASGADIVLPQIQVQYKLAGDNWQVLATAGYNTFDVNTTTGGDVTSWALGVDASITLGALSLIGQVSGGVNAGNIYGVDVGGGVRGSGYANVAGGNVTDNDVIMFRVCAAYKMNDMFGLEIGYGYAQTELDTAGATENEVKAYYVQAPITMAPGVFVIPEFGVIDYEEAGQNEVTYFGAKWQINF
jgi:hypothetical protein